MGSNRTPALRQTGLRAGRLGAGLVLACTTAAAGVQPEVPADLEAANRRCLECHGQTHIATLTASERQLMVSTDILADLDDTTPRPDLYVGPEPLRYGVHSGLRCVDCHPDAGALPHAAVLSPPACADCHAPEQAEFDRGVHADALARGDPAAPTCVSCHGGHGMLPAHQRESLTYPLNAIRLCGDCHREHTGLSPGGWAPEERVQEYLESVHGQGIQAAGLVVAATCADCHDHHRVLPASHPEATTHRERIPATCGRCHLGVVETFNTSVHGMKLAEGDERAPVCTDCHTAHSITHAWTPQGLVDIVGECGGCHDRPEMSPGRRASFYKTYRSSYHGQVTKLGSTRAARCSDCHGAHDILPLGNERSRVHADNRIATCRRCHEGAPARFARFDPHADYLDRDRYPLLHAVFWYFVIIISCAFGFFGMHSLLWFVRSVLERRRRGALPRYAANPHGIRRFTGLNRLNHALLIISFFGLTITGFPLLFSDYGWALAISRWLGGGEIVGVLHRMFAILLIANFVIHVIGLVRKARHHRGKLLRDWLVGPNTMLPRVRDFRDCGRMFRWFFRGGDSPTFDRWTYWEKFDYLAEIIGTVIIGGSGLLLWFPIFFSHFLPGWVFNVAMVVHGYEALLAVGFIFTVHFFNAHLRVDKFPVDDVIFTGQVPEEEFKHERGDEYRRLLETGELAELRVPPAPPWQRRLAVIVGVTAMAVGFTLVALIIVAGFQAL
jgi:cytochrome b subunit of formate dehydrogenase